MLASFGTKYDAKANGVGGSIAQYFATGVAAQNLALSGGAAVATGEAALASAEPANVALRDAVREAHATGTVTTLVATRQESIDSLADAVAGHDPVTLGVKLAGIDTRLKTRIMAACPDQQPVTCAVVIRGQEGGLRGVSAKRIRTETTTLKGP